MCWGWVCHYCWRRAALVASPAFRPDWPMQNRPRRVYFGACCSGVWENIWLPGELVPDKREELGKADLLRLLWKDIVKLLQPPLSRHVQPEVHAPMELEVCIHALVRTDATRSRLGFLRKLLDEIGLGHWVRDLTFRCHSNFWDVNFAECFKCWSH